MRTEHIPSRDDLVKLIASMNATQLALWYDIGKTIQAREAVDALEDATFSDVLSAAEIAHMDASDIAAAKAALKESGERITLQQLVAELGIAQ